ncbi:hypothetical protein FA09DRAFT_328894 [Tilletiopsis washingtonensis]|uniref:Uncharacterized protein n=1 Tax=Tilletiopsis washingtonensis TaxID=58919 RepID=A0A316ZGU5_9BASI|nr:hypothetical protein FA09DRAFT_328894 [Tilletiopsis washingtonensis]PWN99513.1 hypothetical protein FA09DRAFT_328894 [Tilletiopsis washingtonensis]
MRFSAIIFASALVALVAAAPLPSPDDVVTTVGKTVKGVSGRARCELAARADRASRQLEDGLEEVSGSQAADEAHRADATALQTIGAAKRAAPGDIQTVGEGIAKIEEGLGVTATEELLDELSGGAITKIEDAVGVDTLDKALGLE